MIEPTNADIGRRVVYRDNSGKVEEGVITSIGVEYVWVRYGIGSTPAATRREDLEWLPS